METFHYRPDLNPPRAEATTAALDTASGYVFVAPKRGPGQADPVIVDDQGQAVWLRSV